MRTTFGIGFYCRMSKIDKKGKAPIEMGITMNGKRVFISLPRKEYPEVFKKALASKRSNPIKEFCTAMETNVNTAMTELIKNGKPLTVSNIKEYVQTGGIKSYTIGNLFDDYLNYYKKRIGVDLTQGAYRKFELSRELFFSKSGMKETDEVTALSNAVVLNYYAELKKIYKNSSYTSYMAKLKTLVKFGIDNGKLSVNPFATVKVQRDKTAIQVLTEEELNIIKNVELPPSLARVRDCFIFQAYSGLSYIDLEHLTKEDIQFFESDNLDDSCKTIGGKRVAYIRKNRIKSGVEYISVLLPGAIEILEKYDYRLPVITNQKVNAYLHTIERLISFKKSLHSHLARHTYCNLLLNKYKVRAETVAKAMGHTTPKTTLKFYADISAETTVTEISQKFAI